MVRVYHFSTDHGRSVSSAITERDLRTLHYLSETVHSHKLPKMSDIPVKVDIPSQEIEFDIEKAVMECFKTAVMAMTSYWEEGTRNRILETCEKVNQDHLIC